jgi:hypothetical protein
MRLPLHIAAPFAAAKSAAALSLLPQHIGYLSMPQISSIAVGFKSNVDMVYNTAIGLLAGAGSYDAGLPTAAPCPQLALMLWFNVCLACLLPLYCLAVMELNSRQRDGSSSSGLVPVREAAAAASAEALQPQSSSSSSSNRAASALEAMAVPTPAAGAAPADHMYALALQSQQQPTPCFGAPFGSLWCGTCHVAALFLSSCLVWAVVDVAVAAVVPQCGKAGAAAGLAH